MTDENDAVIHAALAKLRTNDEMACRIAKLLEDTNDLYSAAESQTAVKAVDLEESPPPARPTSGIPKEARNTSQNEKRNEESVATTEPPTEPSDPTESMKGLLGPCQRALFHCGGCFFRRIPGLEMLLDDVAPEGIRSMKGGTQSACCFIFIYQLLLFGVFGYQLYTSVQNNISTRYLSMGMDYEFQGDPSSALCTYVEVAITDSFELDDNGYFSTSPHWAFADSMLYVTMGGFTTDENKWRGLLNDGSGEFAKRGQSQARDLYAAFGAWNKQYFRLSTARTAMSMVTSDAEVAPNFNARILAEPPALMDASYSWVYAANTNGNDDDDDDSFESMDYADEGVYFVISSTQDSWSNIFPNWYYGSFADDATVDDAYVAPFSIRLNKYSLWVASAVNTGVINVTDLTSLADSGEDPDDDDDGDDDDDDDDDADDYGYDDDDFQWDDDDDASASNSSRRRLTPVRRSKKRGPLKKRRMRELLATTNAPTPAPKLSPQKYKYMGNITGLEAMVQRKWFERMDPILCSDKNCWIRIGGPNDDPTYGATVLPILQDWDQSCMNCKTSAKSKNCADLDLEYLLLFDPDEPGVPYSIDFDPSAYKSYQYDNSGLAGTISISLFEGIEYLNSLMYELPSMHCTKPVDIAATSKKNPLACGTSISKKYVTKNKKGAQGKYCWQLPVAPQEVFLECRLGVSTIITQSLGEAYGTMGTAAAILVAILVIFAQNCLGLTNPPKEEDPNSAWAKLKKLREAQPQDEARTEEEEVMGGDGHRNKAGGGSNI